MPGLLGDNLVAQLILALGLALIAGNGWAVIQNTRGRGPESGEFRMTRVVFLIVVGIVLMVWATASLLQ